MVIFNLFGLKSTILVELYICLGFELKNSGF